VTTGDSPSVKCKDALRSGYRKKETATGPMRKQGLEGHYTRNAEVVNINNLRINV